MNAIKYATLVLGLLFMLSIDGIYTPIHAASASATTAAMTVSKGAKASTDIDEGSIIEELENIVDENLTDYKEKKTVIQSEISGLTITDYSKLRASLLDKETLTDVEKITLEVSEEYISESNIIQGLIMKIGKMSDSEQVIFFIAMISFFALFLLLLFGAVGAF